MASPFGLLSPTPLEIPDINTADKWKKFNRAWMDYSLAMELNKKSEAIQVATVLYLWSLVRTLEKFFPHLATSCNSNGDNAKIQPVLTKFAEYIASHKNTF